MFLAGLFAMVFAVADDPDAPMPSVKFAKCQETKLHIAVRKENESSMICHFHIITDNMKGKQLFARVQCAFLDKGKFTSLHTSEKEMRVTEEGERLGFFISYPRFTDYDQNKMIYQIEVGYLDRSQVDEHQLLTAFAWKLKDGRMVTGAADDPLMIPVLTRVVVLDEETKSFKIVTVTKTYAALSSLEYGVADFTPPKNGEATAFRTQRAK